MRVQQIHWHTKSFAWNSSFSPDFIEFHGHQVVKETLLRCNVIEIVRDPNILILLIVYINMY